MKIKNAITGIALVSTLTFGAVLAIGFNKKAEKAYATYSQGNVIANNKARIWIGYDTGNPFYTYADASTGIRLWIHSNTDGGDEKVYGTITGEFDNQAEGGRRYDFFDVDLSVYTNEWYMTVQKFQNENWKASTNPIQLKAANAFQVYFVWGDWAWDKTQGTVGAGSIDSVDAGLAAKALGGMHTCSNSSVNGYNAFENFNSTFVMGDSTWKTVGNLSDYTLNDFADGDTSYSGSAATETNAYDKYLKVQAMYTHTDPSSLLRFTIGNVQSNGGVIAIAIVSAIAVGSIGSYFFIRRKHEK